MNLVDLVYFVQTIRTGGYDVEFDILPNQERARIQNRKITDPCFYTIIRFHTNAPIEQDANGEYWYSGNTLLRFYSA